MPAPSDFARGLTLLILCAALAVPFSATAVGDSARKFQIRTADGDHLAVKTRIGDSYFIQLRSGKAVGVFVMRASGERQALKSRSSAGSSSSACPAGTMQSCWEDRVEQQSICTCNPSGGTIEIMIGYSDNFL